MKLGNYPFDLFAPPTVQPLPSAIARRRGFTLIELLAVIAIIAVLGAILIPMISGVRARGAMSTSASNLRQLATAVGLYANENNGYPPFGIDTPIAKRTWHRALAPYLNLEPPNGDWTRWAARLGELPVGVYNNPVLQVLTRSGNEADYGINNRITGSSTTSNQGRYNLNQISQPSRVFLFGETHNCDRSIRDGWLTMSALHPGGLVQVVYVDGSVAALKPEVIYGQNDQYSEPWGWAGRRDQVPQVVE